MLLSTEQINPQHADLDQYSSPALVRALVDDQLLAVRAVQACETALASAVDAALPRLLAGGRLLYVGAGTSGRLGLLDSVELHPTFSWPHSRAKALLAGGHSALFEAVEGAEDDEAMAVQDFEKLKPGPHDVAIGIAASGRTPYVRAAMLYARDAGALTIAIVNNVGASIAKTVDFAIELDTGPEVISGSTRLKAGTAQKIALNTLSSALMVRMGKVYGNLMVDLRTTNIKLRGRAEQLTQRIAGGTIEQARSALLACDYRVKVAVLMLRLNLSGPQASERLAAAQDKLRVALGDAPNSI
jgi:N-acetylmuramic acid 6-phosphate etherase